MSVLPAFGLHRPTTLDEALELITFDDLPLSGGTELLLAMRMRLLRPDTLVQLRNIPELRHIELREDHLIIGGGVTHQQAAEHPLVSEHFPILPEVLNQVGNPRIRASGTLAGNLVFAEPKSDVMTILMGLDARLTLESQQGSRTVNVTDFILGPYFSDRQENEILTEIALPLHKVVRAAYVKFQTMERPTVAVAALDIDLGGMAVRRVVVGAVGERPYMIDVTSPSGINPAAIVEDIEPIPDISGTVRYKRHVTAVSIARAIDKLDAQVSDGR